jgi:hypothetical protein
MPKSDPALHNGKLGLTVPEAAALSSLGQTSLYKAIREGRLANPKVWHAHDHHAGRFGLLLGKPVRKVRTA